MAQQQPVKAEKQDKSSDKDQSKPVTEKDGKKLVGKNEIKPHVLGVKEEFE